MLNNVVLMFSPTDEKTPYEQGENASLKTVNYLKKGIYTSFKQKSVGGHRGGPVDRHVTFSFNCL